MSALMIGRPEAAARLNISRATLDNLVAAGKLRSHLVGRRRLFTEADLAAFIESTAVR